MRLAKNEHDNNLYSQEYVGGINIKRGVKGKTNKGILHQIDDNYRPIKLSRVSNKYYV